MRWDGKEWIYDWNMDPVKMYDYYHTVSYLKFNDNTEVDIEVYFSEGFTEFVGKWEDFVKAFNR